MPAVPITEPVERPIHNAGKPFLGMPGPQEVRRHHWRKREGDDPGNENRAGERERELAEERAGQSALESDRRIDRGERDRHRDDRADQFARTFQGRVQPRHAFAHVTLDVFHNDDRVVDDETDR